jgi:hypothetical protein
MKKTSFILIGISLILAFTDTQAKGGKPGSGDQGGGNNMTLCLTFNTGDMQSDGGSSTGTDRLTYDYCNGRSEYISLLAGDAGFNFETNTRNNIWSRWVYLDLGDGVTPYNDEIGSGDYSIIFRFDKDDGGLDLNALEVDGDPGYVSVSMWLYDQSDETLFALAHGTVSDPLTSGELAGNDCVKATDDLEVSRTTDTEWVFSYSGWVCMWDKNVSLGYQSGVPFEFSYEFRVTKQP